MKTVNFLGMTFDQQNNVYKTYRKPKDEPTYINKNSNHPPSILKKLTKSTEKRLSETSSSKEIFEKSLKLYQDALNVAALVIICITQKVTTIPTATNERENETLFGSTLFFPRGKDRYC